MGFPRLTAFLVFPLVVVNLGMIQATVTDTFDYVIAGGGTTGLLLAVALSADPNVSVAVLEAGVDGRNDPRITIPENEGGIAGTELDWSYTSVPQKHLYNNATVNLSAGKTLGGSSAMNFMIWHRASRVEFDAWESVLGISGWNWDVLFAAFKASETFTPPPPAQADILTYNAAYHGSSGPIAGTMERSIYSLYDEYVVPALESLGVPKQQDSGGGTTTGVRFVPLAINATSYTRSYSGSVLTPVESRSNLKVFTNLTVSKIIWSQGPASQHGLAHATGLQAYTSQDGYAEGASETKVLGRNIILSAGAIGSPRILELSGVGDPAVLGPLAIETKVALPAVGAQLQDHLTYAGVFSVNKTDFTGGEYAQDFMDYAPPSRFLSAEDYATANRILSRAEPPQGVALGAWEMLKELWAKDEPVIEFGWFYSFARTYLLHPLSQGTVHISSADPEDRPAIDPNLNSATIEGRSWDLWLLSKAVQYYATALPAASPMTNISASFSIDPSLPFEEFQAEVYKGLGTGDHWTGSCAMLPRERGGVVDDGFLVYGTDNLRVVDASIIPVSPGQHTMGLAWALAVRAATMLAVS